MRKTALALAAFAFSAVAQPLAPPPAAAPAASPAPASPAAGPPSAPAAGPQAPSGPAERGTVLEEVSGKVAEVDRKAHRLRVDTASGPVTLSIDRNTMVYTATGLGTVVDVTPGVQIRAGRNADFLAYWVQVRNTPPSPPTPSTPGQGTGPAGGGSAPAGEGAGGTPAPPSAGPGASPGPGGAGPAGGSSPR